MRILPRTPKGTWLLAAVAWAILCSLTWLILPPAPRAIASVPGNSLLGFGPDCATALVMHRSSHKNDRPGPLYSLVLLDTATGQPVATLVDPTRLMYVLGKSRDGNTWLLSDTGLVADRLVQLDLAARKAETLPLSDFAVQQAYQDRLSADGRHAAIYCPRMGLASGDPEVRGLFLWDAVGKKQRAFFSELEPPFEFSGDGRWLTAAMRGRTPKCIGVVDLETLRIRETQIPASDMPFDRGCLSDDGSHLAQCLSIGGPHLGEEAFKTSCWNLATGAEVVKITGTPFGRLAFSPDGRYLFHIYSSIWRYDLVNGGHRTEQFGGENACVDMSPDGRFLLRVKWAAPPISWRRIVRALGLNWNVGWDEKAYGEIFDTATWSSHGIIPGKNGQSVNSPNRAASQDVGWGPDGKTLAAQDDSDPNRWFIWDIPPRKPLSWFAIAAAVIALPVAGLAWRRTLRLRREVA